MRTRIATIVFTAALASALLAPSIARAHGDCGSGRCRDRPYGDYCREHGWGRYGAKQPVKSADEARQRLEEYYAGEDVVIGAVTERKLYFESDISDKDGKLLDSVILDKRSGRIRSIL